MWLFLLPEFHIKIYQALSKKNFLYIASSSFLSGSKRNYEFFLGANKSVVFKSDVLKKSPQGANCFSLLLEGTVSKLNFWTSPYIVLLTQGLHFWSLHINDEQLFSCCQQCCLPAMGMSMAGCVATNLLCDSAQAT